MPTMHFLTEIGAVMDIPSCDGIIKCTVFEDNNGSIELAKAPNMRPRTKHAASNHHHFRSHAQEGEIFIEKVDALEQEVDFLTH